MPEVTVKGRALAATLMRQGYIDPQIEADVFGVCSLLKRHARTYCRMQETWCSVELSDRATATLERREAAVERRIGELAAQIGLHAEFQGDPRGHTVRLKQVAEQVNDNNAPFVGVD